MFLDYKYVGKLEDHSIKVELYETGKRTMFLKKVYAYQVFQDNRLIDENEYFIPKKSIALETLMVFNHHINLLNGITPLQLEYIECFEVVQ